MFDIRPGEHLRTWSMFAYLLCVLFAYYILKPVSRSMFLTKFDIDKLPSLYILIAAFGGVFAYLYSKLAARTSLRTAVFWTMAISVGCLTGMWFFIRLPWMVYALNIFVSLFSIVLVSQGWLVASNLFDAREAKRLYPLLGMGMVLGAAFGGEFTNRTALLVGTRNLLLASAGMVILAYISFRLSVTTSRASIAKARAAEAEATDFSFSGMIGDITRTRHLQVIVGMMAVMYLVDTFVEYQFQVTARGAYRGDQLTAFFGHFYGLYLNLTEFVFQLFLTAAVVRHLGVGGTLQIAPAAVMLSSIATAGAPGVLSAGAVRLTEASTRYTLNRTGMELLYMPLPRELRNRIKAFIDICVDRLSRGVAGVLLLLLTTTSLDLGVQGIAIAVICMCVPWMYFAWLARREYVATIRRRLESRRLDMESVRVAVNDAETVRMLEAAAQGELPRPAIYALSLLAQAPRYDLRPLLLRLAASPLPEVREKAYEVAAGISDAGAVEQALSDWHRPEGPSRAAVTYVLKVAPGRVPDLAALLEDPNPAIAEGAVAALRGRPDCAAEWITREWLDRAAVSRDPHRRALAAEAIGICGDGGTEALHRLLDDPAPEVAASACRTAATLRNRAYVFRLIELLAYPRLRREAIAALAAYGPSICGTLADLLLDDSVPARIRLQVPRVLKHIPAQRSVDVLLQIVASQDLGLRAAALKALNRLREAAPQLDFDEGFVTGQISKEARHYFELSAALSVFRGHEEASRTAARLLARTIEERLRNTLERLFRLLGLRYPPKEIYSAYLAVASRRQDQATAALEFLDNTLERNLKRILLPLLDAPEHVTERGRELFGVTVPDPEQAVRDLIRSHDPWLVACAMAAAAELNMRSLAPDIAKAAAEAQGEVSEVARSARLALAA